MRGWTALLLLLTLLICSGPVSAQDGRDEARAIALEGIGLLKEGKFAEAITKLKQAEQKFHAPTHLLFIARAQRGLEQHIAAHNTYVDILVEKIPNYAPAAFHDAKRTAASELLDVAPNVATLTVTVSGVPLADVTVAIDDQPVGRARLAHPIAVEPGRYAIRASAAGAQDAQQTADAVIGETKTVSLTLTVAESDVSPDPLGPGQPQPTTEGGGFPVAATIALSIGGAALIVGGITGGITLSQASDIKDNCNGNVCPETEESDADSATKLGNVSTAMFIVGGVAATIGVVLLVVDVTGGDSEAAQAEPSAPRLQLAATPGGAVLLGTF